MRNVRTIALVLFVLILIPGLALAGDRKIGLGYQGVIMGSFLQGVSARGWVQDNVAWELTLAYANGELDMKTAGKEDADVFDMAGKILYSPIVKEQSRFYVGLEAGYGVANASQTASGAKVDGDATFWTIGPLFGVEYWFKELPELGFCWEVGYRYNSGTVEVDGVTEDMDLDLHGISVGLGMHYYF